MAAVGTGGRRLAAFAGVMTPHADSDGTGTGKDAGDASDRSAAPKEWQQANIKNSKSRAGPGNLLVGSPAASDFDNQPAIGAGGGTEGGADRPTDV